MWWNINIIEYKVVKIHLAEQQSPVVLLVRSPGLWMDCPPTPNLCFRVNPQVTFLKIGFLRRLGEMRSYMGFPGKLRS